jgi:hypothetical protein
MISWMKELSSNILRCLLFALFLFAGALLCSGCMTLRIDAQAGATVNVSNSGNKTVDVPVNTTLPAGLAGAMQ